MTKKKSKGKGGKGKAAASVEEELPSFFRFFETPDLDAAQEEADDEDEDVRTSMFLRPALCSASSPG